MKSAMAAFLLFNQIQIQWSLEKWTGNKYYTRFVKHSDYANV